MCRSARLRSAIATRRRFSIRGLQPRRFVVERARHVRTGMAAIFCVTKDFLNSLPGSGTGKDTPRPVRCLTTRAPCATSRPVSGRSHCRRPARRRLRASAMAGWVHRRSRARLRKCSLPSSPRVVLKLRQCLPALPAAIHSRKPVLPRQASWTTSRKVRSAELVIAVVEALPMSLCGFAAASSSTERTERSMISN